MSRSRFLHIMACTICWLVAIAFSACYLQIFGLNLADIIHPDEATGYMIGQGGYFHSIAYYWKHLIGRYGAIAWFEVPLTLSNVMHISPWIAIVAGRAVNFIFALGTLALLLRHTAVRLPASICIAIAAAILSAALVSAAVQDQHSSYFWLLDQAIYLFSFIAYCVVLTLFWRIARGDVDRFSLWLLPAFAFYLGAHEVNLVSGGLILAIYFFALLYGPAGFDGRERFTRIIWPYLRDLGRIEWSPSRGPLFSSKAVLCHNETNYELVIGRARIRFCLLYGSAQERLLAVFVGLSLIYMAAACIQVFSPSLSFRNSVWPTHLNAREAIRIGIFTGITPLLDAIPGLDAGILPKLLRAFIPHGLGAPIIPILLGGLAAGIFHWNTNDANRKLRCLLWVPVVVAFSTGFITSALAAKIGLLSVSPPPSAEITGRLARIGAGNLDYRQGVYVYLLWYVAVFFIGVLSGSIVIDRAGHFATKWFRSALTATVTIVSVVWLSYTITIHPAWNEARAFNWPSVVEGIGQRFRILRHPPGFDGKYYLEEMPRYPQPMAVGPAQSEYPYEKMFESIFRSQPIVFAPCAIVGAHEECNRGDIPLLERRLDSTTIGLSNIWTDVNGGSIKSDRGSLVFQEDMSTGNHYLATRSFPKADRTLVEVRIEMVGERSNQRRGLSVQIISDAGMASVQFNPINGKVLDHTDNKVRALDAHARHFAENLELNARFVVPPGARHFSVRIESELDKQSSYRGDRDFRLQIANTTIRLLDSGKSVGRLRNESAAANLALMRQW